MKERVVSFISRLELFSPLLGRILGVRVRLHYTWLLAVVFITAAVITQFSTDYSLRYRIILGVAASVLFFFGIITREFVLNFIAVNRGITVKRVTLFAFGAVHEVSKESSRPSLDLLLAVIGMLVNVLIAGIFFIIYTAFAGTGHIVVNVLVQWLAFIYLMLTLFHLVPAFPLDMGRILRALLWKLTGNYEKVTRISGWIGWVFGVLVAAGGVWFLVRTQELFTGVFLVCTGLILQNAATHSRRDLSPGGSEESRK